MNKIVSYIAVSMLMVSVASVALAVDTVAPVHAVGSTLEIHLYDNGKVVVRGAKVSGISGSTISASISVGSYVTNWSIVTTNATQILRRFGSASSLSEIQSGDYISFTGTLDTTASQPTVSASVVKDWSLQSTPATFSGTIASSNTGTSSFVLSNSKRADITVTVNNSTKITKGGNDISFSTLKVGDIITKASGIYNNASRMLQASNITVYEALTQKRTFQGTLKSVSGTTTPLTLVLTINSIDYTVNVPANVSILNHAWLLTSPASLKVGDTIRVYGAVRADNATMIDASVVRDTSI